MLSNIIRSLVTRGIIALINLLILVLSARYLGVSTRGEISVFLLNIVVCQALNEIYTGYSIIHFLPRYDLKKLFAGGVLYTLLCCTTLNILFVNWGLQVSGFGWAGFVVSLLVVLHTFNCVLILGKQNVRLYNVLSFMQPALLLAGLIFYNFSLGVFTFSSYFYPLLFSFGLSWLVSSYFVIRLMREANGSLPFSAAPVFRNGIYFQFSLLMFVFANRFSYYVLPGAANVGLYSAASSLMESVLLISSGIAPVLISVSANQKDHGATASLTVTLAKISFFLSGFCILILLFVPESFLLLILGKGFKGLRELMLWYAPGILLVSFFALPAAFFSATGQQKKVFWCYLPGVVHSAVAGPFLMARYGLRGAALTALISYILMFLALTLVFIKSNQMTIRRLLSFTDDVVCLRRLLKPRLHQ